MAGGWDLNPQLLCPVWTSPSRTFVLDGGSTWLSYRQPSIAFYQLEAA